MSGPVFGFLVFSDGSFSGAVIRDISLANSLHQRGYGVVIYWLLSCNRNLVSAGIRQRILGIETPERDSTRTDAQTVDGFMESFCRKVCDGGESDPALETRLLK